MTTLQPPISIIIPTFNRSAYLGNLIPSLLKQSRPPHEIIVVDDHSTDDTALVVQRLAAGNARVKYFVNEGRHQRDAKKTGLKRARGEYVGFLDDDVRIENHNFFADLRPLLAPDRVVQAKVILEQMGRQNRRDLGWKDIVATRPFPVLELVTSNFNRGSTRRPIFPLIEWGNFWHRSLQHYFIDDNLIKDGYGESYSASVKLHRAEVKLFLEPSLVIRHTGAPSGGSHKFNKKNMLAGFTEFHYGYFHNMIYLHRRFYRGWIWLWLPFYTLKSLIALAVNRDFSGWRRYAAPAVKRGLTAPKKEEGKLLHPPDQEKSVGPRLFIWQGGRRGGAEYVTAAAAEYFAAHGLRVAAGVYEVNPAPGQLKQIAFPRFNFIPPSFRPLAASLIFRLRHAREFDAVYTHKSGAWKAARLKLFVHDAADLNRKLRQAGGAGRRLAYRVWRYLYLNLCLKKATAIFAASPEFVSYLTSQNVPGERVIPVSSFYDDKVFRYRRRSPSGQNTKLIFVGHPADPAKNFALAKRLFYGRSPFAVAVAGSEKISRDNNFTYLGWLTPRRLRRALDKSDIFFMPSKSEGFSVALLEALATGIPCLVSGAAAPSSLAGVRNLVTYRNEKEVTARLDKIIENYSYYNRPDPRLARFTMTAVLASELAVINKYLAGAGSGSRAAETKIKAAETA